jgi:hypothetical protein
MRRVATYSAIARATYSTQQAMKTPEDIFDDRRRALEEAFFARRNEELLEALRQDSKKLEKEDALAKASGITEAEVLDNLSALGIGPETLAALSLVPLVEVAYASGRVELNERRAVLSAAEMSGLKSGDTAYKLLEQWLQHRPDPKLFEAWRAYIAALVPTMNPDAADALKKFILDRGTRVAEAAGGFLGIGSICKEERQVLDSLATSLSRKG